MFIRFLILAIFALPTTCNSDLFAQSRAIDTTSSAKTPSLWTRTVGEDWPRMLGAQYDSTSREKGIRKEWGSKGLEVVWAANTGEGYGNGVALVVVLSSMMTVSMSMESMERSHAFPWQMEKLSGKQTHPNNFMSYLAFLESVHLR